MELNSLNEKLYDDFFVQELDSRLETDPLMTGGLFDIFDSQDSLQFTSYNDCIENCGTNCGINCGTNCGINL
jgi:hypothetical protein